MLPGFGSDVCAVASGLFTEMLTNPFAYAPSFIDGDIEETAALSTGKAVVITSGLLQLKSKASIAPRGER